MASWASMIGTKTDDLPPSVDKPRTYRVGEGQVEDVQQERRKHTVWGETTHAELYSMVPDGTELIIFRSEQLEWVDHVLTLDDMYETLDDFELSDAFVFVPDFDLSIKISGTRIETKFKTSYNFQCSVRSALDKYAR